MYVALSLSHIYKLHITTIETYTIIYLIVYIDRLL